MRSAAFGVLGESGGGEEDGRGGGEVGGEGGLEGGRGSEALPGPMPGMPIGAFLPVLNDRLGRKGGFGCGTAKEGCGMLTAEYCMFGWAFMLRLAGDVCECCRFVEKLRASGGCKFELLVNCEFALLVSCEFELVSCELESRS